MTREIPMSKGLTAIVDDADYPLVSKYKWYFRPGKHTAYAQTVDNSLPGHPRTTKLHRLILAAQPGQHVDHVDGNGLNNTRTNLRICTYSENSRNSRKQVNTSSQYKGVSWKARSHKWVAQIYVDGHTTILGYFVSELDAARAYDAAARLHFGQFARTNF